MLEFLQAGHLLVGPFQNQTLNDHRLNVLADVSLLSSDSLGNSLLADLGRDLMIWFVESEVS